MAGLLTRPSVRLTVAASASRVSRLCWELITSYPSACRVGMSLLKHEPSAQRPWTNTMLGLVCVDIARSFTAYDIVGRIPTLPRVVESRVANPDSHGHGLANLANTATAMDERHPPRCAPTIPHRRHQCKVDPPTLGAAHLRASGLAWSPEVLNCGWDALYLLEGALDGPPVRQVILSLSHAALLLYFRYSEDFALWHPFAEE